MDLKLKCWQWLIMITIFLTVYLSGCYGLQMESERQARSNLEALSQVYHPGDLPVTLPTLDQNSTLATLIT